jgi:hypothetical protein
MKALTSINPPVILRPLFLAAPRKVLGDESEKIQGESEKIQEG